MMERFTTVLQIRTHDNYQLTGKLDLPAAETVDKIVIYVNGSGPNTYDNRRKIGEYEFNYYDLFADELSKRGIAFFRYNTRGVSSGPEPPMFTKIDEQVYKTYLPSNSVKDVEAIISYLKDMPQLKNAKVYLLGWSEGTIIATLVAKNKNVDVDGLLLAGYVHRPLHELLEWQFSGESSMITYRRYFGLDDKSFITKEVFEEDKYKVRESVFNGVTFEDLDMNHDSIVDEDDLCEYIKPFKERMFRAIEERDDEWLKQNYLIRLTTGWFMEHFALPGNREVLPTLDIPIHIFHGEHDESCPVKDVFSIADQFKALNKHNLQIHVFAKHGHDLNYMLYPIHGIISEGIMKIFEVCEQF